MLSRFVLRSNLILRTIATQTLPRCRTFVGFKVQPRVFLLTSSPFLQDLDKNMSNMDVRLREACELGESAVVELLDALKIKVIDMSKAYKECLQMQIDIMKAASKQGALSSKLDELPEYRTLGTELNHELQNFVASVNAIGQIASNEALQYITQQKKLLKVISAKHKDLEKIIKKQFEEIKKLESKIVQLNKEAIEKAKTKT